MLFLLLTMVPLPPLFKKKCFLKKYKIIHEKLVKGYSLPNSTKNNENRNRQITYEIGLTIIPKTNKITKKFERELEEVREI